MAQDLFGRDTGPIDFRSMMHSLNGKVSQVLETKDSSTEAAMKEVAAAVKTVAEKIDSNFQKEEENVARYCESVLEMLKDIRTPKSKSGNSKKDRYESADIRLTRKAVEKIQQMGASPNTFWVGVGHFGNQGMKQLKQLMIDCGVCGSSTRIVAAINNAQKDTRNINNSKTTFSNMNGGGNKGNSKLIVSDYDDGDGGQQSFNNATKKWEGLLYIFSGYISDLGNAFEIDLTDFRKGILTHSNKLRENLRATIFQTQGYSESFRDMEKDFLDLYTATDAAGVSAAKYDSLWVKNLQRGFAYMSKNEKQNKSQNEILKKQVKIHKSVQTSALNTASALGMSAETTNDMFMNWHMQLGMSANEMANMGRSMRQISLSTGVTGTNLERAMQSADAIMKTMRNTGALTDTSAANVMQMTAMAQKLGVDETMNPLLNALGGGTGMFDADPKTQTLLNSMMTGRGAAGKPDEMYWSMRSGNFLNDNKMMGVAQENMGVRARTALRAAKVKNADTIDLSQLTKEMQNMSQQQQALVQSNFQTMVGALPGEFERINQVFEEGKKTEGEKLKTISDNILKAQNRGAGGSDATKALERQKVEMETSNIQQVFGKISDQMKQGKTEKEATAIVQQQIESKFGTKYASELMNDFGGSAQKLISGLDSRAKEAELDLNKLLKQEGTSVKEINKALTSGNAEERENASLVLNETMQRIAQQEKSNADPITQIGEALRATNNYLQRIVDSYLFTISDTLLEILFWSTKLAGIAGTVFTLIKSKQAKEIAGGMFEKAKNIFNGGSGGGGGKIFGSPVNPNGPNSPIYGPPRPPMSYDQMEKNIPSLGKGNSKSARMERINQRRIASGKNPLSRMDFRGKAGKGKGIFGKIANAGAWILDKGLPLASRAQDVANATGMTGGGLGDMSGATPVYVVNANEMCCGGESGGIINQIANGGGSALESIIDGANTAQDISEFADMANKSKKGGMVSKIKDIFGSGFSKAKNFVGMGDEGASALSTVTKGGILNKTKDVLSSGILKTKEFFGMGANGASTVSKGTGLAKGALGKVAGPLSMLIGGLTGAFEAEDAGRGTLEGATYGALTGGAKRGSMFSGLAGVETGSATDDAMGVLGAAGTGALTGAAIGSIIPGVGTAIGAGVGAVVGAGAEITKIFTDPESKLRQGISGLASTVLEGASSFGSTIMEGVSGLGKSLSESDSVFGKTIMGSVAGLGGTIMQGASGLGSMLSNALFSKSKDLKTSGSAVDLGLFDKENARNALDEGVGTMTASIEPSKAVDSKKDESEELINAFQGHKEQPSVIGGFGLGLFDNEKIGDAMQSGISLLISSIINPIGSLMQSPLAKTINTINKGDASTNLLDYSDTIKGTVSHIPMGFHDAESKVAQEKYGSMPKSSIAGMDGVEGYLAEEQHMIKIMIEYLAKIENNTKLSAGVNNITGSTKPSNYIDKGMKMRRISQEQSSGQWEITAGDFSPSANTTH